MGETAGPRGSGRGVLVGSLLVLAVATAIGFGRVFAGAGPSARLAVAALLSTAIATLLARRHLLIALAAGAGLLLVVLGALIYPETLWFGIPRASTFESVVASLERLGADAAREIAPAPPLRSLQTAALLAVWAATTAAHALAVRARSPVLALVPGAVLVAFAGVVTAEPPRPLFALLYLGASFGVLYGSSIDRLSTWGPLVERPGRHRLVGGTTGRWAGRLAVVAGLVAVTMPGVLPGFGSTPLMTIRPGQPATVSINPIVDIRPTLLEQPASELFVVASARPTYWRLLSLDRFDGRTWTSDDLTAEDGTVVGGSQLLSEPSSASDDLVQTFEIRALAVPWLPAAYRPVEAEFDVDGDGGAARWDPEAAMLATNDGTEHGDTYTIRSELVQPTASELDRAYDREPLTGLDSYVVGEQLELPPLPAEVGGIAERITRGEDTPYAKALAIQEHLRTFDYDLQAPAGHGVNDILFFLTESRRGYCEQFAGTMAVLLRTIGVPARVAIGFAPGTQGPDGRWSVTTQDAHAWVEAYFPGHGWVAFEPTPTRTNPVAQPYLSPPIASSTRSLADVRETTTPRGPSRLTESRQEREGARRGEAPSLVPGRADGRPLPLWMLLGAAAAAALVGLGVARAAARRVALASARSPAERVIAAYRVFEASAADVGAGRRLGETVDEYGGRLERDVVRSGDGVARLATLSTAAAYSRRTPTEADADEAVVLARRAVRDVRRRVGLARTAMGAVRPAPPL